MTSLKPSQLTSRLARSMLIGAGAWVAFGATASGVAGQGGGGGGGGGGFGRAMDPAAVARLAELRAPLDGLTRCCATPLPATG
jgi:hypothetical protein